MTAIRELLAQPLELRWLLLSACCLFAAGLIYFERLYPVKVCQTWSVRLRNMARLLIAVMLLQAGVSALFVLLAVLIWTPGGTP